VFKYGKENLFLISQFSHHHSSTLQAALILNC
jgi:hypothetical protein